MAPQSRQRHADMTANPSITVTRKSILEDLLQRPYAYDFFQAVRLLRAAQARGLSARSGDPVKFRTLLSLETPASAIYSLHYTAYHALPVMTVTFMGLTGPSGALPVRYTEMLLERRFRHKDQTAHHFFELFNHRLITLFYHAWQKHHIFVAYEHGVRAGFQQYLLSLVGMGTPGLQQRLEQQGGVDDRTLAYYSGLFVERQCSAIALGALLTHYFGIAITIEQFRGQWLMVDTADCTRLGLSHCTLGQHPMVGQYIWDYQSKFRLRVGPLTRQRFRLFLPTGSAYRALVTLVKYSVGHRLEFDIQLILKRHDVPSCTLTSGTEAPRLGWTSWLQWPINASQDADNVILPEPQSLGN